MLDACLLSRCSAAPVDGAAHWPTIPAPPPRFPAPQAHPGQPRRPAPGPLLADLRRQAAIPPRGHRPAGTPGQDGIPPPLSAACFRRLVVDIGVRLPGSGTCVPPRLMPTGAHPQPLPALPSSAGCAEGGGGGPAAAPPLCRVLPPRAHRGALRLHALAGPPPGPLAHLLALRPGCASRVGAPGAPPFPAGRRGAAGRLGVNTRT